MLKKEVDAVSKNKSLRLLRSILLQPFNYYKIDPERIHLQTRFSKRDYTSTKDYVLSCYWLWKNAFGNNFNSSMTWCFFIAF